MVAIHFSSRTKVLLIWGGVVLTLAFLFLLRAIVTPFLWALLTTFILNAVVAWAVRRFRGPRWVWVLVIYFGLVAALIWGLVSVVPVLGSQVRQLVDESPKYLQQIEDFARSFQLGDFRLPAGNLSEMLRRAMESFLGGLSERAPELAL